ncbi:J domain-containing protein [Henriciella sp. AS95]|uniref:J domain-containing protein n=1 Tax=Henriciella sp. AS95 TaxID=3135782 RepID=UPI003171898C
MFWTTYLPILVAQVLFALVYLGWPILKKVGTWTGRKLANAMPAERAGEELRFESRARAGMERDWGPYSARFARAFSDASSKTRSSSPPPPPPPPPVPPPPDTPRKAHLRTLGLSGQPDAKALRSTYRKLAKKFHPDQFASSAHSDTARRKASARMSAINEAYDWLVQNT